MNPADLPCARALFAHWQRVRGGRATPAARPFSRGWEDLLEDARLSSAAERDEAERDARKLAADGWIELKAVRYRAHLIERVVLPLEAEARWRMAFGFVPPSDEEVRQVREFPWVPELEFLRDGRVQLPFEDLRRLNEFLAGRAGGCEVVPIKERSLQILGEEKRLDLLVSSVLFKPGRLDLARDLRCEIVGTPLGWKRGPAAAAGRPIIVLENAATWHSYCRWNEGRGLFGAVVYGDGRRFAESARYLRNILVELGGDRPVLYFGDLDPAGLIIPQDASARLQAAGLPSVEPHLWSYRQLLALGAEHGQAMEPEDFAPGICDWLGPLAGPARKLLAARRRLAQERVGWEFLRAQEDDAD